MKKIVISSTLVLALGAMLMFSSSASSRTGYFRVLENEVVDGCRNACYAFEMVDESDIKEGDIYWTQEIGEKDYLEFKSMKDAKAKLVKDDERIVTETNESSETEITANEDISTPTTAESWNEELMIPAVEE